MDCGLDDLLLKAFQARHNELPDLAQDFFTRAMAHLPGDPALQLEIARCLVDRGLRGEARTCLDSIVAGDDSELTLELARLCRLADDVERSLAGFRAIPRHSSFAKQADLEAVLLLERLGRTQEAAVVFSANDTSIEAVMARAILAERAKDGGAASAGYCKVLATMGDTSMGIEAGYRLARLTLAAGDPEAAFQIIRPIKAAEQAADPAGKMNDILRQRAAEREAATVAAAGNGLVGDNGGPAVWMITGHPRSGTTLLARLLQERGLYWIDEAPAFGALAREMSICSQTSEWDIKAFSAEYRSRLEDWGQAPQGARLLDKNPGLWPKLPSVVSLIPGWRGIVLLRDPRDVALSCYFQRFGPTSLGAACRTFAGAVEAVKHAYALWFTLRSRFLSSVCLELRYEELVRDPAGVLNSPAMLSWLGAFASDQCHPSASRRLLENPSYAQIEQSPHTLALRRWECLGGARLSELHTLDPIAKKAGYD